jgi:DHA2 family multidrug resistance protein
MSAARARSAPSAPSPVERPALIVEHRGLLMVTVMAAMIMQMLDTTIANVALPHMQAALLATQDTVTWVLTSYVLASAVVLPLAGWLVDRLGLKWLLIGSVTLFTIASIMCGLAQNLSQMVAFRVFQGIAGAFLSPLAQTIMLDTHTAAERPRVMSIFTQGIMIGPIAGPVLGGYLTENFDWRWVFFVNVPIGIACVFALLALLPASPRRKRKMDLFGWLLVAVAVSSLQLMLDRGTTKDWFGSWEIVFYAVISVSAFWMFGVHLATSKAALFPPAMLRDRNFVTSIGLMFLVGLVMFSVMALMPVMLQTIYGYPAIDSGWLLTPRGFGMLLSMMVFGRYLPLVDPRILLGFGLGLMALSLYLMTGWAPAMPAWPFILSGFVQGVGLSFTFMPLNMIMFATLEPKLRTDASGLANLSRNLGSSTGIAIVTVLLGHNIQVNHAEIGAQITRFGLPVNVERMSSYGQYGDMALRIADAMVNRQAAMIAYLNDYWLMMVACLLAIPVLLLVRPPRLAPPAPGDLAPTH